MVNYDDYARTFSYSRRDHQWDELTALIRTLASHPGAGRVLDVGCGNGRLLEECARVGYVPTHYLGVDSSTLMIAEARQSHPGYHFEVLDMRELSRLTGSYDAICLIASYHHLETREERL